MAENRVSWSNGILSATVKVYDKNSSGNFTAEVSMTNTSSTTIVTGTPRISVSVDGESSWTRVLQQGTLDPGATISTTASISTGNTSSQTVVFSLLSNYLTGNKKSVSVNGYSDPTPYVEAPSLSISPTTQYMGQKIAISESGGDGYSVTERRVSIGGTKVGTFSTGQWTIPVSTYEPYATTSNSVAAVFQTRCTARSGYQGSDNSNSVTVNLVVPANYLPTATHTYEFINAKNSSLVAGYSSLKVDVLPQVTPDENSAQIVSCVLHSITTTNPAITTAIFTQSSEGNSWTSSVLPNLSGTPSYTFSLIFRVTDTRGNVCDYTTNQFRVTNFIPPYCTITNLKRTTSTTGKLEVSIISPSHAHLATVKVGDNAPIDVLSQLVMDTEGNYTLDYTITGLDSGSQYLVTFNYQDTNMAGYDEKPYPYKQLLSTMGMPLSLYDDGSKRAASFGEECADDYGEECVINFAKDSYVRVTNDVSSVTRKAYDALTYEYTLPTAEETVLGGIKIHADGTALYIDTI